MKKNHHPYFKENDFNVYNPNIGHEDRFFQKLQKKKNKNWKWMSIAASITLLVGFYLGNYYRNNTYDLKDISPQMAETQTFFVATIRQEIKDIEQYRSKDTEIIIEDALEQLEVLDKQYKIHRIALKETDNKQIHILEMIRNYQQKLEVLEHLSKQLVILQKQNNLNIEEHEII